MPGSLPYCPAAILWNPSRLMFSAKDIIKIMTQNAAAVIGRSNQLGTLEPGQDQGHPRNPRLK